MVSVRRLRSATAAMRGHLGCGCLQRADGSVGVGRAPFVRGDERGGGERETTGISGGMVGTLVERRVERMKCREMAVFCGIVS